MDESQRGYNDKETNEESASISDRNLALKNRDDVLQLNVNELVAKEDELQRTISGLNRLS